jgi:hypothetical protein
MHAEPHHRADEPEAHARPRRVGRVGESGGGWREWVRFLAAALARS